MKEEVGESPTCPYSQPGRYDVADLNWLLCLLTWKLTQEDDLLRPQSIAARGLELLSRPPPSPNNHCGSRSCPPAEKPEQHLPPVSGSPTPAHFALSLAESD